MPLTDLDQPRAMAFLAEVTSARNLLAYGVHATRTAAFTATTLDPIPTMLSIGVEKLYKLTLGVARLDREGAWPGVEEMKRWGHNLDWMHDEVMSQLDQRTKDKSRYVGKLLAAVRADPVIPPLLEALDAYGQMGRFYYLDSLGGHSRADLRPDQAWDKVIEAARNNCAAQSGATPLIDDNDGWREYRGAINERNSTAKTYGRPLLFASAHVTTSWTLSAPVIRHSSVASPASWTGRPGMVLDQKSTR